MLQAPDPTVTVGEQQSYAQSLLSRYRMRLGDLDHFELKNEVNRLNHFLAELNLGIQISSSGTKASLIESLLKGIREIFFDTNDDQSVHISRISCDSKEPFSAPLISDESGDSVISLSDDEFEFEKSREHPAEDIILSVLRRTFRHSQLKDGQNWVINRVLSHQKSLLVLPTGAGKSLAFLLPSLLICPRDGITIVISPLIALMRDQMRKLPFNLPAACLSGEVTAAEAAAICTDLKNGYLRILFISPERLCSPSFRRLINLLHRVDRPRTSQITDDLSTEFTGPGVGLLCIDEAHCLSQWSFNFRPSFLRIRREIERIQPKSILALTATAPVHVQQDIQNELGIVSDGIWIQSPARPNLQMMSEYVSNEDEKRKVIIEFLQQSAVVKSKKLPTIIYVWRRNEAESLSEFLQQQGLSSRPYHAGMPSAQRIKIQYLFNRGVIDVVGMIFSIFHQFYPF